MTKLLTTIDKRVRYLDRAFPKSRDRLLNEEIERELARLPDGGKAFTEEFFAEFFPNSTAEETARGTVRTISESDYKAFLDSEAQKESK
jgi:hypothetical protein